MSHRIPEILKANRLSITTSRVKILELFLKKHTALSYNEIERTFYHQIDRVTIYRTLTVFIEKGIIHNIPTSDSNAIYALCKNECIEGHHHDEHVHFICNNCGETSCLEKVLIPKITLPKGYIASEIKMVVMGQCGACVLN